MYLSWNWLSLHLCPKISFTKFFDFNFLLRGSTSPFLYGPIFCELFLFLYGPILWTFSISCSYVFPSSFTLLATSFALFNSSFFITILIGWSFFFFVPKNDHISSFQLCSSWIFPSFCKIFPTSFSSMTFHLSLLFQDFSKFLFPMLLCGFPSGFHNFQITQGFIHFLSLGLIFFHYLCNALFPFLSFISIQ